MPRPCKLTPSYLRHPSGKARAVWTDPAGVRRFEMLPGPFNSPESLQAFAALQMELAVNPVAAMRGAGTAATVSEVLLPYLRYAAKYHGTSSELEATKSALKAVRELYGMTPAGEFGPLPLKAVRESFVRNDRARPYCNRQTRRVVQAFRWASAEELVPATVHAALKTLSPLRSGKTEAPEIEPRMPADPAAVLPFLPTHTRALVSIIRHTGMRPGEACRMTLGQIDRSKPVWVYRPTKHKGKGRAVHLGATAQAVITDHLGGKQIGPDEPIFSPKRQRDELFERKRAARKSKVQPSQRSRKKAEPKKVPGERFTPNPSAGRSPRPASSRASRNGARTNCVTWWARNSGEVQPRTRPGGSGAQSRQHERPLLGGRGRGLGGGGGEQGRVSCGGAERLRVLQLL